MQNLPTILNESVNVRYQTVLVDVPLCASKHAAETICMEYSLFVAAGSTCWM